MIHKTIKKYERFVDTYSYKKIKKGIFRKIYV